MQKQTTKVMKPTEQNQFSRDSWIEVIENEFNKIKDPSIPLLDYWNQFVFLEMIEDIMLRPKYRLVGGFQVREKKVKLTSYSLSLSFKDFMIKSLCSLGVYHDFWHVVAVEDGVIIQLMCSNEVI